MHRDKRVVAWIPYGREQTVSILHKYLLMDKVIDEVWLCMNTDADQVRDREYANELAEEHAKVIVVPCPGPNRHVEGMPNQWKRVYENPKQLNTGRFPILMQDEGTIWLRFDDDIVWVHPETPRRLVDRVLDGSHDTLAVFAMIYNNAISSWLLQQNGRIPTEWGVVGQGARNSTQVSAVDPVGWGDPWDGAINRRAAEFAVKLHEMVLDALEEDRDEDLALDAVLPLGQRQQYSVSCFGIAGKEYADLNGILDYEEEEHWLTQHRPQYVRKRNIVLGSAPVSHYTFFTQRDLIMKTDVLDRYRAVADYRWRREMYGNRYYERLAEQTS